MLMYVLVWWGRQEKALPLRSLCSVFLGHVCFWPRRASCFRSSHRWCTSQVVMVLLSSVVWLCSAQTEAVFFFSLMCRLPRASCCCGLENLKGQAAITKLHSFQRTWDTVSLAQNAGRHAAKSAQAAQHKLAQLLRLLFHWLSHYGSLLKVSGASKFFKPAKGLW